MSSRLLAAGACAAVLAAAALPAGAFLSLPPPETLYTRVVEGDHSPPFDVARRNDKGEIERGTCVLTTGASVEVVTGVFSREALAFTCLNDCVGLPNHSTHAACDLSCDVACPFRHAFMLTPREIMPPAKEGQLSPLARLQTLSQENMNLGRAAGSLARDITARMRLDGETAPMQRALFESLEDAADWGDEFALNADFDDPEWDGPNPVGISVQHWNPAPCSFIRRGYGYIDAMLKLTPLVDVAITTPAGTQHQIINGEPVIVGHYWYPYSKPLWQADPVVACKCHPADGKISDRPHFRIGADLLPLSTRAAQLKAGMDSWGADLKPRGLDVGFLGHDMNQFRLRVTNNGTQEAEVVLTPGTLLLPDNSTVQVMVVVERVSLVCPPGATRVASLIVVAQADGAKTAEKTVRIHCLEIQKKEPSDATRFIPAAPDDDKLVAVTGYYEKARIRGVWDQGRTWAYSDQASLDEMNRRVLPNITKAQYLNGLFDVAEAGAFDYKDSRFLNLVTPSLLLGTSASSEAKGWAIGILSRRSPGEIGAFLKENAPLFAGSLGPEAGEVEVQHSAAVAAYLCASPRGEVRQAGLTFLKDTIPAAQREKLAEAGALEGALNLAVTEKGPVAAQAAETIALFTGKRAGELLNTIAVLGRTPEARQAAAARGVSAN